MGEDLAVAIIVPANNDAERGLDWVARCESLSPYHRQFLEVEARKDNESDYSSDIGTRSKLQDPGDALKKMYKGHFLLAFSHVAKANSTLLWRIGYGRDQSSAPDKDVDIIVVPPEMPHGGVRPTHAFIQINAKSGCLMLAGVSSEFPVRYQLEDGMINLFLQDKHVLHQPVNRFYLGSLEFMLVFQNQSDQEYAYYVRTRNEHLENHGKPLPHAAICALPRRVHLRTCGVIVHDTLWKGAYGTVKAAVDSRTGDPMAIKEAALLTDSAVREFRNELNLNRAFPDCPGLLQAVRSQCEHGHTEPCGKIPESAYLTFPLALSDFSDGNWNWKKVPTIKKLSLLHTPLEGLARMHQEGYMHRDVSVRNMLVMSMNPPKAVLCDFGKAIRAHTQKNPRIGPPNTLAPEIAEDGSRPYNNKIDIWSFGWVCCYILFSDWRGMKHRADEDWIIDMRKLLADHGQIGPLESQFTELISMMINSDPELRPTAAGALKYACMLAAAQELATDEKGERPAKMPRLEDPDLSASDPEDTEPRYLPKISPLVADEVHHPDASPNDTAPLAVPDQSSGAALLYTTSETGASKSKSTVAQYREEEAKKVKETQQQ